MFHRSLRLLLGVVFLATLMLAGGRPTPALAFGESDYVESVVRATDISHITQLIENALHHGEGLSLHDADLVYEALGRTNTALELIYSSAATGDVFNTAEHLLLTQQALLEEIEQATLSGDLADLSTVAPLLVDFAQARVAFDRQSLTHNGHFPVSSFGHSGLFDRRLSSSRHSLLGLDHRNRSLLGFGFSPVHRSVTSLRFPSRSFSRLYTPGFHSSLGRVGLSRSRLLEHSLLGTRGLSRYRLSSLFW